MTVYFDDDGTAFYGVEHSSDGLGVFILSMAVRGASKHPGHKGWAFKAICGYGSGPKTKAASLSTFLADWADGRALRLRAFDPEVGTVATFIGTSPKHALLWARHKIGLPV